MFLLSDGVHRPLTSDPVPVGADVVRQKLAPELAGLDALYKHLHSHPELSFHEEQTAARLAKELRSLGFEVTEKVGGHGIVGVFKNGPGPTVLVRTDMDALPVTGAAPVCPTPARCGCATRTIRKWASCMPVVMIST